jgi:hypothetical protein
VAGSREAQAPATRARRAWLLPVVVMPPWRRRSPVEYADGVKPREFISWRGCSNRVRSPRGGHGRHRDRAWHPAESLERLDNRGESPGLHLLGEFLFQTRPPCGVLSDRSDVFLGHDLLRGGGPDDLAEPAEVGRPPGGAAGVTDIVPQEKGFAPQLRGLEIVESICTRPAQVPHGFIRNCWDRDRGESPRAHQAGQFDGIPPVGCDAIPGLFGDQGGRHDAADLAFCGHIAVAPIATRPSFLDQDAVGAFGLQPATQLIDSALARPAVAKGDNLGVRFLGDVGDGHGLFMNISPDGECARLVHG